MNEFQALILGILQGLTEFFPSVQVGISKLVMRFWGFMKETIFCLLLLSM
jgi:undecaprenyl pyrophosphate phosphatase UppP